VPLKNGESNRDGKVSDSKQCMLDTFAEHITSQILKGSRSAEVVDKSGIHVIKGENGEQSTSNETSAADHSDEPSSSEVMVPTASVTHNKTGAQAAIIQDTPATKDSAAKKCYGTTANHQRCTCFAS